MVKQRSIWHSLGCMVGRRGLWTSENRELAAVGQPLAGRWGAGVRVDVRRIVKVMVPFSWHLCLRQDLSDARSRALLSILAHVSHLAVNRLFEWRQPLSSGHLTQHRSCTVVQGAGQIGKLRPGETDLDLCPARWSPWSKASRSSWAGWRASSTRPSGTPSTRPCRTSPRWLCVSPWDRQCGRRRTFLSGGSSDGPFQGSHQKSEVLGPDHRGSSWLR